MKALVIFSIIYLAITGCSNKIQVFNDYDPDYNLLNYRTFTWDKKTNIEVGKNPLYYNELNDKRIKSAVDEQLLIRDFKITENQPELILHYHILVDDYSIAVNDPWEDYYGPNWTGLGLNIYTHREGTLILDFIDAQTKNLVWRGWAVSAINKTYTQEKLNQMIITAISEIFKNFPKTVQSPLPAGEIVKRDK